MTSSDQIEAAIQEHLLEELKKPLSKDEAEALEKKVLTIRRLADAR